MTPPRTINRRGLLAMMTIGMFGLSACQSIGKKETDGVCHGKVVGTEKGIASWYSIRTNRGTRTASGRPLCDHTLTAAHRRLPFGTPVRVTNTRNGKSVVVTITDRGPFIRGRVLDVSLEAAKRLEFQARGLAPVKVEILERRPVSGRT